MIRLPESAKTVALIAKAAQEQAGVTRARLGSKIWGIAQLKTNSKFAQVLSFLIWQPAQIRNFAQVAALKISQPNAIVVTLTILRSVQTNPSQPKQTVIIYSPISQTLREIQSQTLDISSYPLLKDQVDRHAQLEPLFANHRIPKFVAIIIRNKMESAKVSLLLKFINSTNYFSSNDTSLGCNNKLSSYQNCINCASYPTCSACDNGFLYQNECLDNCPLGFYGQTTSSKYQIISSNSCQCINSIQHSLECDSTCRSCSGSLNTNCTSCKRDFYLSLEPGEVVYGKCVSKFPTAASLTQTNIYVAPTASLNPSLLDGSSPFWAYGNLMDAIERAYELAAPYYEANITIILLSGNHFLIRNVSSFYYPSKMSLFTQNLNLIIQPQYCGGSVVTNCVSKGTRVKVFNKMRGFFKLEVSRSLSLVDIEIDSLESTFDCKNIHVCRFNYDRQFNRRCLSEQLSKYQVIMLQVN